MSKSRQLSAYDIKARLRFLGLVFIAIYPALAQMFEAHLIDWWQLGAIIIVAVGDLVRRFLTNYTIPVAK